MCPDGAVKTDSNHSTHVEIMSDQGWGSRRNVAPYLGVAIVFVIGFWGILTPILLAFPEEVLTSVVCVAGALLLGLLVLWKFVPANEMPSAIYSWVLGRKQKDDGLEGYEPVTKRRSRLAQGQQAPPSAEAVRDIKESSNNWVPTGAQAPKRITRSRRLGTQDRKPGDDRHSLG
jgi:hypothetical protein